jgi:hypothetical protein
LKSRLWVTDHRRVKPITINTDKLYDTDLTDAAWALIAPMLLAARRGGRPRTTNIRAVLNAVIYHNTLLLSRVHAQKQAAGDHAAADIVKDISPNAWQHVHLIGAFERTSQLAPRCNRKSGVYDLSTRRKQGVAADHDRSFPSTSLARALSKLHRPPRLEIPAQ